MTDIDPIDEEVLAKKHKNSKIVWRILIGLALVSLYLYLTLSNMFAWERTRALRSDLDELQEQTFTTRSKSNCLALYRNDVSVAIGQALAANNDLWVSVATRPFSSDDSQTAQEREAEMNDALGRELDKRNRPLLDAVNELYMYDRLDPPPEICPHPDAALEDHPNSFEPSD